MAILAPNRNKNFKQSTHPNPQIYKQPCPNSWFSNPSWKHQILTTQKETQSPNPHRIRNKNRERERERENGGHCLWWHRVLYCHQWWYGSPGFRPQQTRVRREGETVLERKTWKWEPPQVVVRGGFVAVLATLGFVEGSVREELMSHCDREKERGFLKRDGLYEKKGGEG